MSTSKTTDFDRKRRRVEQAYKAASVAPAPSWLRYVRERARALARVYAELLLTRIAEDE